jgi:rhodanese-related sulfurtransferase
MDLLAGVEFAVQMAFSAVPQMSADELAQRLQTTPAAITVLDVRSPAEFAVSHIAGAKRFEGPAADFQPPASGTVVLYCSVGYRSSELAQQLGRLHAKQHPEVRFVNLKGSLFRWALEDRPLVAADGAPTRKVHGFNATWARLLPDDRVVLPQP